jgi:hypothetical protein
MLTLKLNNTVIVLHICIALYTTQVSTANQENLHSNIKFNDRI